MVISWPDGVMISNSSDQQEQNSNKWDRLSLKVVSINATLGILTHQMYFKSHSLIFDTLRIFSSISSKSPRAGFYGILSGRTVQLAGILVPLPGIEPQPCIVEE